MTVEWVLVDNDLVHLESGIRYTTLCGKTYHRDDVERERFTYERHSTRCFDCDSVQNRNAVERSGGSR